MLALDTVTTPFSVEITLSIEETARMHGWNSFVMNMFTDDNPEAIVDLLLSHRPDGHCYLHPPWDYVRFLSRPSSYSFPACWPTAKVSMKRSPAIFLMMNRAVRRRTGVTRRRLSAPNPCACIYPQDHLATTRRRHGLERACREAGLDPDRRILSYMAFGDEHYRGHSVSSAGAHSEWSSQFDSVICDAIVCIDGLPDPAGAKVPPEISR